MPARATFALILVAGMLVVGTLGLDSAPSSDPLQSEFRSSVDFLKTDVCIAQCESLRSWPKEGEYTTDGAAVGTDFVDHMNEPFESYDNEIQLLKNETLQATCKAVCESTKDEAAKILGITRWFLMLAEKDKNGTIISNATSKLPFSAYNAAKSSKIVGRKTFQSTVSFHEFYPTNAPTTNAPTTNAPTTNAPTTNAPTTNAPTTNAPVQISSMLSSKRRRKSMLSSMLSMLSRRRKSKLGEGKEKPKTIKGVRPGGKPKEEEKTHYKGVRPGSTDEKVESTDEKVESTDATAERPNWAVEAADFEYAAQIIQLNQCITPTTAYATCCNNDESGEEFMRAAMEVLPQFKAATADAGSDRSKDWKQPHVHTDSSPTCSTEGECWNWQEPPVICATQKRAVLLKVCMTAIVNSTGKHEIPQQCWFPQEEDGKKPKPFGDGVDWTGGRDGALPLSERNLVKTSKGSDDALWGCDAIQKKDNGPCDQSNVMTPNFWLLEHIMF